MSIYDNLQRTHIAVALDKHKKLSNPSLGTRIGEKAVDAIMNGIGSKEWVRYMALFCDTREELQRLTVPDPDNDGNYMPQMRAYIVANAVCFSETFTQTANGVNRDVEPLPNTPVEEGVADPAAVRPFTIPNV
jgi:hypothetical protein